MVTSAGSWKLMKLLWALTVPLGCAWGTSTEIVACGRSWTFLSSGPDFFACPPQTLQVNCSFEEEDGQYCFSCCLKPWKKMACIFAHCNTHCSSMRDYSHPCLLSVALGIMCLFWHDPIFLHFNLACYLTVKTVRDNNFQKDIFTWVAVLHSHKRTESACHLPVWWQSREMNGFCSINSLQTSIICVSTSVYSFLEAFSPPWQLPVMIFFFCQGYDRRQIEIKESIREKKV